MFASFWLFASFWVYAVLPPFLVSLGASGLLRFRVGSKLGLRLAEIGPVLGFLVGFIGIAQGVPFLNNVANHPVGELAVFALATGIGLALLPPGPRLGRILAVGAALLAIFWQLSSGILPAEQWLVAGTAASVAILVLDRLVLLARIGASTMLVLAIASLSLIAISVSAKAPLPLSGMALALAAACAGWLVWARPFGKIKLCLAAAVSAGMVFVTLAFKISQSAAHPPWALAPLIACFWAEAILQRLPVPAKLGKKKPLRPLLLAAAAAIPALAAAVLGVFLA